MTPRFPAAGETYLLPALLDVGLRVQHAYLGLERQMTLFLFLDVSDPYACQALCLETGSLVSMSRYMPSTCAESYEGSGRIA